MDQFEINDRVELVEIYDDRFSQSVGDKGIVTLINSSMIVIKWDSGTVLRMDLPDASECLAIVSN